MKKIHLLLIFAFTCLTAGAQTTLDTAVNFQVKDIYGVTHRLFDILDMNKYVVLNVHTTSCGPCVTYAPDMQQAYVQYGMNNGSVYFLGIVWGASNAAVHDFDSTYGITYPCVSGSQGNGNSVILNFDIQSYPTALLIAPDRHIVNKYMYPPSFQVLDSNLSAVLGTTGLHEPDHSGGILSIGRIYPNPVKRTINLDVVLPRKEEYSFQVVNVLGDKLSEQPAVGFEKGHHTVKLDASILPPGMYILKVFSGSRAIKMLKFVKS